MGDVNQLQWFRDNFDIVKSPVLEIGAAFIDDNVSFDYRKLCKELEYTGIDIHSGRNVDIAVDITSDFDIIDAKLDHKRFNAVICFSVLEHVDNIFKAAENISRLTGKNGVLFVSVPFAWRFHAYPNDYWRFTPEGIKRLFSNFLFKREFCTVSSSRAFDIKPLINYPDDLNAFVAKSTSTISPIYLVLKIINKCLSKLKIINHRFSTFSYLLAPCMINMIGIKKYND